MRMDFWTAPELCTLYCFILFNVASRTFKSIPVSHLWLAVFLLHGAGIKLVSSRKGRIRAWYQFSSAAQLCLTLCDPMDCSMPRFPVHHQLPEITQTHVHRVSDAIQPSHPLLSPSPRFNLSQHQGLFKLVSSTYQMAKVLKFQLQHQSFQ